MSSPRPQAVPSVQVDNDSVVVTEWRFAPGAETGWHQHGMDYVVVPQSSGKLRMETAEGEREATLECGQSYARPAGVNHNVINPNTHDFVFIEIEVKA